ncbi:hypothetical protein ACOMHN_057192 [Nucella lapillus]
MDPNTVVKSVAKQLKYYFDVKRLEDGFDLTNCQKRSELQGEASPRARPAVHFEGGRHDRALKHYFSQSEVRAQLTRLEPADSEERSPRERQIRNSLTNTMKKYQFGKSQTPEWFYIYSLGGPRQQQQPVTRRPATSVKSRKNVLKAGWPVTGCAPPADVPPDEMDRLVNNASKILLNAGPPDDRRTRGQPRAKTACQRYPLRPVEKPRGDSTRPRPLTAKHTWDTNGHHLPFTTVKAYSENQADKLPRRTYLRRPQSSPRPGQGKPVKTTEKDRSPPSPSSSSPSSSPRPTSPPRQGRRTRQLQWTLVKEGKDQAEDEGVGEVKIGPLAEYQVTVTTGNCIGASTSAAVHMTLYGDKGRSPDLHLATSQYNKVKFQRGKEDLFVLKTPYVGQLSKIKIGHDRPELSYAWYLDSVMMVDVTGGQVCELPYHRWLSGQDEDGNTHCTFVLDQQHADTAEKSTPPVSDVKANSTDSTTKPRRASLTKDPGPNRRPQSQKSSGKTGPTQSQGARTGMQGKGDEARKQTEEEDSRRQKRGGGGLERYRRTGGGQSGVSGKEERGKDRRPKAVEDKDQKVTDDLEGYKARVEAEEESERQKREEERKKHHHLLSGTTIHDACRKGDLERVSALLQAFPKMAESTDENGWTPLHIAADGGEVGLIRRLTSSGGENLDVETPTGYTPTHLAARNGHSAAIKILNALGASVDCTTVDKQTPLHLAAATGQVECVKCLVASGADVTVEDAFSRDPLTLAQQYSQEEVVDFLQCCHHDLHNPTSTFAQILHASNARRPKTAGQASTQHKEKASSSQNEGAAPRPMTSSQRKKVKEEKELEMKREQYEEQHRHMEEEGVSFLDLIRQEMDQEP